MDFCEHCGKRFRSMYSDMLFCKTKCRLASSSNRRRAEGKLRGKVRYLFIGDYNRLKAAQKTLGRLKGLAAANNVEQLISILKGE